MYIMPQHMQLYHLTTQENIYLCKTAVFPLWPQKNMDESTNDQGYTSWKCDALCCHSLQW